MTLQENAPSGANGAGAVTRRALVVLGMHRSGTSALAGCLTHLGAAAPRHPMTASENNPKGYFESAALFRLHEDLLKVTGSSWNDFRPMNQDWLTSSPVSAFRQRMPEVIVAEYGDADLFVVKDPRMCRLLPLFTEALATLHIQPAFIHIHRNPIEVARSLHRRDGYDPEYGYVLWMRHVLEAEFASRGKPRVFLGYERLLNAGVEELTRVAHALALPSTNLIDAKRKEIDAFLSPELRHHQSSESDVVGNTALPSWLRSTFAIFQRWAENGEDPKDQTQLDAIRLGFNEGAATFGPLVLAQRRTVVAERNDLRTRFSAAELSRKEAQQTISEYQAVLTTRETDLEELRVSFQANQKLQAEQASALAISSRELDLRDLELRKARADLTTAQSDIAVLTAKHTELHAHARELETTLGAQTAELRRLSERIAQFTTELATARTREHQSELAAIEMRAILNELMEFFAAMHRPLAAEHELPMQLASLDAELTQARKKLSEAERGRAEAEEHRRALLASTSWKLTAPLRSAINRLRK